MNTTRSFQAKIFEKINPAIRFSVTRYVLSIGFFLAIAVFGLVCSINLGVDLLPTVNVPVVVVTTSFSAAPPDVIDQQISKVIENSVSTLSGIDLLKVSSFQGSSRVIISFDPSTDRQADANQVATLVAGVASQLPTGATPPVIQTYDPNSLPILQFGIYSTKESLDHVGSFVQNTLEPYLERIDGVANIQIDGSPTREFQVLLNPDKLAYLHLNPRQVTDAITNSAFNQAIGIITINNISSTFSTKSQPVDIRQIASVLVDPSRGINVGQVATVRDVAVAPDYARVNGQPAILVSIQKTTESNTIDVVQHIVKTLSTVHLPMDYSIVLSNDTTGPIRASVNSTYNELLLTSIVVASVCLLFLGKLNAALSVILAVPIALSAEPILFSLAGFNFNLVSLLALVVAIGIVVDDSIVVAENVERYRRMGYSLKDSVLKGASEVFSAVVAASLSLLSVLLPVSFIGGFVGRYIMQFSLGLSAAVFFSLIEAIFFLTIRLAYTPEAKTFEWHDFWESFFLMPQAGRWGVRFFSRTPGILILVVLAATLVFLKIYIWLLLVPICPLLGIVFYYLGRILVTFLQALTTTCHQITELGLIWLRERYSRLLSRILKKGILILSCVGVLSLVTIFLIGPQIPYNFIPQTDGGTIAVNLRLAPGTSLSVTNEATGRLENWLLEQPEVNTVQSVSGSSSLQGSTNTASIVVQLVPYQKRRNVFALIPLYRQAMLPLLRGFNSSEISVSAGGGFRGQGSSLSFTVYSPDINKVFETGNKVIAFLQSNPYVVAVSPDLADKTIEHDFLPNPDSLDGTGISPNVLADTLQIYSSGRQASYVISKGQSYPIYVEANPQYISDSQSLLNLPVYSPAFQSQMTIGQFGSFTVSQVPLRIDRTNRLYSTDMDVDLTPDAPPPLAFENLITREMTKEGVLTSDVDFGAQKHFGPAALAGELAVQGPLAFLLAFFLAYLVMAAQFNSWRYPVYLLLPVPLALVGAILLVWILGSSLDIFGLLGMPDAYRPFCQERHPLPRFCVGTS